VLLWALLSSLTQLLTGVCGRFFKLLVISAWLRCMGIRRAYCCLHPGRLEDARLQARRGPLGLSPYELEANGVLLVTALSSQLLVSFYAFAGFSRTPSLCSASSASRFYHGCKANNIFNLIRRLANGRAEGLAKNMALHRGCRLGRMKRKTAITARWYGRQTDMHFLLPGALSSLLRRACAHRAARCVLCDPVSPPELKKYDLIM